MAKQQNNYSVVNSCMKPVGISIIAQNLKEAAIIAKQEISNRGLHGHFGVTRDWCGGAMGCATTAKWI